MALHSLKRELNARHGRNLFPPYFPMSLLISFCRELALHADGHHSLDEYHFMESITRVYFGRITGMRSQIWQKRFEINASKLLPLLATELYEVLCNEIVSRLVGVDVRVDALQARLYEVIESETDNVRLT